MGGFKLEAKKHVQEKKYDYVADAWAEGAHHFEQLDRKAFIENQGALFDQWQLDNDTAFQVQTMHEAEVTKTALMEEELNKSKEAEIEALRQKAQKKNWDEKKLAGKIQEVEKKYEKLRQKKHARIMKEAQRIAKKGRQTPGETVEDKVNMIDKLIEEQRGMDLDKELTEQFNENYDENKMSEDEKQKIKKEKEALRLYTSNEGFSELNGALRTKKHKAMTKEGKGWTTEQCSAELIRSSQKNKLKKDTVLFRNSDLKGLKFFLGLQDLDIKNSKQLFEATRNMPENGFLGFDRAFLSTTIQEGGCSKFKDDQVEYRILAPQGTMGTYMQPVTKFQEEHEVLLQSGTMFRVVKITAGKVWNPITANDPNYDPEEDGDVSEYDEDKIIVYMEAIQKQSPDAAPEK